MRNLLLKLLEWRDQSAMVWCVERTCDGESNEWLELWLGFTENLAKNFRPKLINEKDVCFGEEIRNKIR